MSELNFDPETETDSIQEDDDNKDSSDISKFKKHTTFGDLTPFDDLSSSGTSEVLVSLIGVLVTISGLLYSVVIAGAAIFCSLEASLDGSGRQEPGREEPGHEEPGSEEPGREEPGRSVVISDQPYGKTKKDGDLEKGETVDAEEEEYEGHTACVEFEGVDAVAAKFIKDLCDESRETAKLEKTSRESVEDEEEGSSMTTFVEVYGSFTDWPTIREFTVELGEDRIEEYMTTWYYEEDWIYCIDLLLKQSDDCSDYYTYEVRWSLPTKEFPVPQGTASIYFTCEVSRIKPTNCRIDVTYNYEGSRYVHVPFKHAFNENWLFRIIESKLKFYETLKF